MMVRQSLAGLHYAEEIYDSSWPRRTFTKFQTPTVSSCQKKKTN